MKSNGLCDTPSFPPHLYFCKKITRGNQAIEYNNGFW